MNIWNLTRGREAGPVATAATKPTARTTYEDTTKQHTSPKATSLRKGIRKTGQEPEILVKGPTLATHVTKILFIESIWESI